MAWHVNDQGQYYWEPETASQSPFWSGVGDFFKTAITPYGTGQNAVSPLSAGIGLFNSLAGFGLGLYNARQANDYYKRSLQNQMDTTRTNFGVSASSAGADAVNLVNKAQAFNPNSQFTQNMANTALNYMNGVNQAGSNIGMGNTLDAQINNLKRFSGLA